MDINLIIHEVKHYWRDHRKVVIAAGVILAIAIIL
jgi:predicted negative regulator of RcsB-dependent stress response